VLARPHDEEELIVRDLLEHVPVHEVPVRQRIREAVPVVDDNVVLIDPLQDFVDEHVFAILVQPRVHVRTVVEQVCGDANGRSPDCRRRLH
jgi:hypothetical protein